MNSPGHNLFKAMNKVTGVALTAIAILAICACSVDRREVARVSSSDHRLVAILIEASGGGAAGFLNYELYINEQQYPPSLKEPILITSHCDTPSFAWVDDHTIQVHYKPPCSVNRFINHWYVPSDMAHGNVTPIEIILVRDEPAIPSVSDPFKLYDPSSLVEVKTLHGFPIELQVLLGVQETGYHRIADVGEQCYPTDVHGSDPGRCFLMGGISDSSALVAFKIGGYAGQSEVAVAYAHTKSGWLKAKEWDIGNPNNLRELKEMTGLPAENYGPSKPK